MSLQQAVPIIEHFVLRSAAVVEEISIENPHGKASSQAWHGYVLYHKREPPPTSITTHALV